MDKATGLRLAGFRCFCFVNLTQGVFYMSNQITWYPIPFDAQQPNSNFIATVGLDQSKIACIAYHFDFRDTNRDGKVTWDERICSIIRTDEQNINDRIGDWLEGGVTNPTNNTPYTNEMKLFLFKNPSLKKFNVNFYYFQFVVGCEISKKLVAGGVTGISKFIYGTDNNSEINRLINLLKD